MYRTVIVDLKVRLVIKVNEGTEVEDLINEMDYQFNFPDNATIDDSDILDYEIMDSH